MFQEADRSSSESDQDIATTEPAENPPLGKESDQHLRVPTTTREVEGASAQSAGAVGGRSQQSPLFKSKLSHSSKSSSRKHSSRKALVSSSTSLRSAAGGLGRGENSRKSHKIRDGGSPLENARNSQSSEADPVDTA